MTSRDQPSLDVVIERLKQNTVLTQDVKKQVSDGFKTINGRVSANEKRLDRLEWQRENEKEELENAREDAKEVIANATTKAQQKVKDTPDQRYNKWLIGLLVSIIIALIGAGILHR